VIVTLIGTFVHVTPRGPSRNIVNGCWNCRNLVRKCGNVDRNTEIYFRNVEMSREIFGNLA